MSKITKNDKMIQFVGDYMKDHDGCLILKKGRKYISFANNEVQLTSDQAKALAFGSREHLDNFLNVATCDARNAQKIGRSVGICPIGKTEEARAKFQAMV